MTFKEEYTNTTKKDKMENKKKKVISDDAFAIGDMIERLINKIEHSRLSLIK